MTKVFPTIMILMSIGAAVAYLFDVVILPALQCGEDVKARSDRNHRRIAAAVGICAQGE